jgi:hypothetical protein
MDALDLTGLTAAEIVSRVRDGRSSAVDVARAHLARIAEYDPEVGAFAEHDPVRVLAEAGLTGPQQMDAVLLLCAHVRNTLTPTMSGTQPWTPGKGSGSLREQLALRNGDYAAVLAATRSGRSEDNGWRFGLELILDGLEVQIGGIPRAARARR